MKRFDILHGKENSMSILLAILFLADPISLVVQSGTVVIDGKKTEIGQGTFIPAPYDADLAKKIVDYQAEIEKCKVSVDACEKKSTTRESYWSDQVRDVTTFYQKTNKDLKNEVEDAKGPWNTWIKPVLCAVLSAGVAAFVTYEVVK